jgi:aspartate kinase
MKILKFSGAIFDSALKIKKITALISKAGKNNIAVFSASPETRKALSGAASYLYKQNQYGANEIFNQLEEQFRKLASELLNNEQNRNKAYAAVKDSFEYLRVQTNDLFTLIEEKKLLAQGETLTTLIVERYLEENGLKTAYIPAVEYMRTDRNLEPDAVSIRKNLLEKIKDDSLVYITEGSVCRNAYEETDLLEGGGNLSASLVGAAVRAEEIQIWTDDAEDKRNGSFNFEEAAELAYFGDGVLHPTCISPARLNNIPVRVVSINFPESEGTLTSNHLEKGKIKAVAAKDNITLINIKSGQMLLAHGFLRKVFEVFETYRTPIDMVVTSEVGVSVTIDDSRSLPEIIDSLKRYGTVSVEENMSIICVIGDLDSGNLGFESAAVGALKDIPIKMISYGGSKYNISFLVKSDDQKRAYEALHNLYFA